MNIILYRLKYWCTVNQTLTWYKPNKILLYILYHFEIKDVKTIMVFFLVIYSVRRPLISCFPWYYWSVCPSVSITAHHCLQYQLWAPSTMDIVDTFHWHKQNHGDYIQHVSSDSDSSIVGNCWNSLLHVWWWRRDHQTWWNWCRGQRSRIKK